MKGHFCIHIQRIANGYLVDLPKESGAASFMGIELPPRHISDKYGDMPGKSGDDDEPFNPETDTMPVMDNVYTFKTFPEMMAFIKIYLKE